MSYETRRLMVAYFTGGSELIAASTDATYSKLPQHMAVVPWFYGETEVALTALEEIASEYEAPLEITTGSFVPVGKDAWRMNVYPVDELEVLHRRVIDALGKLALYPEDRSYKFWPVILKDTDQPRLPAEIDLEIDHLALVEDHQTGSYSIPECVPIGNTR